MNEDSGSCYEARIVPSVTVKARIISAATVSAQLGITKTVTAIIKRYRGGVTSLYLIVTPHLVWVTDSSTEDLTVMSNTNWNVN